MPDLSTKTARRRLPASPNKQWSRIARGRSVGYRRPGAEAGTWYVRLFAGDGRYKMKALATADDIAPADGEVVLTYGQATAAALIWSPDDEDDSGPWTVRRAVESYLAWFKVHRKSYGRIKYVFDAHILPPLGETIVEDLTARRLRCWHQDLAASPARLRGGQPRPAVTEDQMRARKVTANRSLTALKAALNRAYEDGLISSDKAWRKVKPFRGVEAARVRYLEQGELTRLINACPADLRYLVLAGIHTGGRYGEVAALSARDYLPEARAVHFPKTKSDSPRHVYLTDEAVAFFDRLTASRAPTDRVLSKADGTSWGRNHQYRPLRDACTVAGIDPPLGYHQLRHTYASLYLMSGGSLVALAKQLGHSTTRMVEKHYGHLADSWRAAEARKHAPKIGGQVDTVTRIRPLGRAAG